MGFNSRNVTRVDEGKPRALFELETHAVVEEKPDDSPPALPISHMIEEKESMLIFSYDDVFRVDKALGSWRQAATLSLEYRWGRPDAVGAYPSVCTVHAPIRDGEPYILATSGDGFVVLADGKATSHGLPGQLSARWHHSCSEHRHWHPLLRGRRFGGTRIVSTVDMTPAGWAFASLDPPPEVALTQSGRG